MPNRKQNPDPRQTGALAALLDVPLRVTVEIGSTRLPISELLNLGAGKMVELDQLEGEPLIIKAGGKIIARGVAVEVNGKLAVRITEIVGNEEKSTGGSLPKTG